MKLIHSRPNHTYASVKEEDLDYTLVMCLHSSEQFKEILDIIPKIKESYKILEFDKISINLKESLKVSLHKVQKENIELVESIEDLLMYTEGIIDSDYDGDIFSFKLIYNPDGAIYVSLKTVDLEEIDMIEFIFEITNSLQEISSKLF